MERLGILLLPPGWNTSRKDYSPALWSPVQFTHPCEQRQCGEKHQQQDGRDQARTTDPQIGSPKRLDQQQWEGTPEICKLFERKSTGANKTRILIWCPIISVPFEVEQTNPPPPPPPSPTPTTVYYIRMIFVSPAKVTVKRMEQKLHIKSPRYSEHISFYRSIALCYIGVYCIYLPKWRLWAKPKQHTRNKNFKIIFSSFLLSPLNWNVV